MLLIIEIGIAIVAGLFVFQFAKTIPHKRAVKRMKTTLTHLNNEQLFRMALEGYDYLLTMQNRDQLMELSFCKEEERRSQLISMIADDTADRFAKVRANKFEGLKPLITAEDKAKLGEMGYKIHEVAEKHRLLEALRRHDEKVSIEQK